VKIDDWDQPSKTLEVKRFVISEHSPAVVFVPAGYANGFMSLSEHGKLMFFSSSSLQESLGDDIRFPARHWDPWHVEER
jgi:dTDP-4-dehydrorhamnose 3,5-epimerase-like enzyme